MFVVDQDIGVVVTDLTLSVDEGSGYDDSGSDDSGSSDSCLGDSSSESGDLVEFIEAFGGSTICNGYLFTFPSGSESWAGFANMNTSLYPISISSAGSLTFNASVPSGASVDVFFRFEKNPHPDVEPSFNTAYVTVTGSDTALYSVDLPAQGSNTFSSLNMYVVDQDIGVIVTNINLSVDNDSDGADTDYGFSSNPSKFIDENGVNTAGYFTGVFGGENGGSNTLQNGDVFTFPAGSAAYGGFANDNTDLYPLTFNEFLNGSPLITFCASSDSVANVFFRLESNPWPANNSIKDSEHIEISGDGVMNAYTAPINLGGFVESDWRSFLMYIEERDLPVTIGKIKGNWNGYNSPDLIGYCDDFIPNSGGNSSGSNPVQNTDTDGDGYDNFVDAFPNDSSEWIDTDQDGIGNNSDNDDDGDGIVDWEDSVPLDANSPSQLDAQIISVLGNPVALVGKSTPIDIGYDVSNGNNQTTGLGLRVHYDSSVLQVNDVTDVLSQDLIVGATGPLPDTENFDNDFSTDVFYSLGWASLFGNWPNQQLATKLMTFNMQVKDLVDVEVTRSTAINFSSTATAAGYEFSSNSYDLELLAATWDFDGNGQADALTDGLIMLRYAFGLRGDNLIDGVMAPESNMSAAEVELVMQDAADMLDIDLDGEVSALTDGLLLLRYLFELVDENLVNGVVAPSAARSSLEDITTHLDRYMPRVGAP
jgi:hypothetical protein